MGNIGIDSKVRNLITGNTGTVIGTAFYKYRASQVLVIYTDGAEEIWDETSVFELI